MRASRELSTPDLKPRPSVTGYHGRLSVPVKKTSSGIQSSATWTSNSGDMMSDTDEIANRDDFVEEYNRLAKKHGVRQLIPDQPETSESEGIAPRRNWWSRTFRRTSSQSTEHSVKRKRSIGHVTAHMIHPKRDSLKDQDLQGLVRLCGKSFLYLPPEYAPGSLILPTCFRATAQYLVHLAPETRGVFRIPGSVRVVNELYEFYCAHQVGGDVANTVRSPNLPSHISPGVHDVASLFKKFLAGLPGGILGSLSLFDALVAINSQLYTDPEFSRTKQSKLRARLIALAVGTMRSQYRRELICAVFGLLCLLGRAAETAPREDDSGRPLPTSDLMGYSALGIVFGPLLIGDMLSSHAVKLADPSSGLFLVPVSPQQKPKKEKKKAKESTNEPPPAFWDVDKIHVANDITEMLITNWRDVVKQMRNLDESLSILRHRSRASISENSRRATSLSRNSEDASAPQQSLDVRMSEDRPPSPTASSSRAVSFKQVDRTNEALSVKKTRHQPTRSASNLSRGSNFGVLSPPREESCCENQDIPTPKRATPLKSSLRSASKKAAEIRNERQPTNLENISPTSKSSSPSVQPFHSSTRPVNPIQSTVSSKGATPVKRTKTITTEEYKSTPEAKAGTTRQCDARRTTSGNPKASNQDDLAAIPGKNLKPTFSCDLDSMTAYAVVPGAKILSGTSTMRYQPKNSHTDSTTEITHAGSSSRSVKSTHEKEDDQVENAPGPIHIVTPDQMDGAADIVTAGNSYRGLFHDLRDHHEGRKTAVSRPSSYPLLKSWSKLPAPQHNDGKAKGHKLPPSVAPQTISPMPAINRRGDLKRGTNKVLDLAAKFDNAARASPFIPTVEDGTQKQRREVPGLVSPYTSNPSPLQSATSVSTPASLMRHSRDKLLLPSSTADSANVSRIPRPQHMVSGDKIKRQASPTKMRDESGPSLEIMRSHPKKSRLPTPSRAFPNKEVSDTGPVSLVQLDGSSKILRTPLTLTARHEIRPVAYYSSPLPPRGGSRGLPRLSQHSITSAYSEAASYSQDVSSPSLSRSPSRGRSASSLRDQIRSLRQELSAKSEEYAQLRLDFEENRKASQVNEILLREDLDCAKADLTKWKRRAERAESKVEMHERLATRAQDIRERNGGQSHDFSFVSGLPDDIDVAERSPQHQPLSARMNQSVRRAPENVRPTGTSASMGSDAMSDCSRSTVVRNTDGAEEGHWASVDELVEISPPGIVDDIL